MCNTPISQLVDIHEKRAEGIYRYNPLIDGQTMSAHSIYGLFLNRTNRGEVGELSGNLTPDEWSHCTYIHPGLQSVVYLADAASIWHYFDGPLHAAPPNLLKGLQCIMESQKMSLVEIGALTMLAGDILNTRTNVPQGVEGPALLMKMVKTHCTSAVFNAFHRAVQEGDITHTCLSQIEIQPFMVMVESVLAPKHRRLLAVVRACVIARTPVAYPVQIDLNGICYELVVCGNKITAYYRVPHRSGVTELVSGQCLLLVNNYLCVTSSGWMMTSAPSRQIVEMCPYNGVDEGPIKVCFKVTQELAPGLEKVLVNYGCLLSMDGIAYDSPITILADLERLQDHLDRRGFLGSPDFLSFCLHGDNNLRVVMEVIDDGVAMQPVNLIDELYFPTR
jgi:hypothetical protein